MNINLRKTLQITAFIINLSLFSQTHRFIYEFKYKTDSLQPHFSDDPMVLDIDGNDVQFYEMRAIQIDSINQNMQGFSEYSYPFAKLKRKTGSAKNTNYHLLANAYLSFETEDKINWKINEETQTRDQWKLQKATAHFGGRSWEAWFTQDIPLSEGPYKFNSLPGLIVEVKDSENNFSYTLTKVENPKNPNPKIIERVFKKKPLAISYSKYKSMLINHYKDPFSIYRSMKPGTWSIGRADETFVEDIEGLNKITKEEQQDIRKNNNPIERNKAIDYTQL